MKIDINSPDGNIFVALGLALKIMKFQGKSDSELRELRFRVMSAENYTDACRTIEIMTEKQIRFYDGRKSLFGD